MLINKFEGLSKQAKLIYLKIKGDFIEELVLDEELIRIYALHDYLAAVTIQKNNYSVLSIHSIDTTEEKIWESICIDSLFVN